MLNQKLVVCYVKKIITLIQYLDVFKKALSIRNCVTAVTKLTNEEIIFKSQERLIIAINYYYIDLCVFLNQIKKQDVNPAQLVIYILLGGICYESQEQSAQYLNEFWVLKVECFILSLYQYYQQEIPPQSNPSGNFFQSCKLSLGEYHCDEYDVIDQTLIVETKNYMCISCNPLCQYYQFQRELQVQKIAPSLQYTNFKTVYTKECNLPIIDPFINYNPYLKTAQYFLKVIAIMNYHMNLLNIVVFLRDFQKPQIIQEFKKNTQIVLGLLL